MSYHRSWFSLGSGLKGAYLVCALIVMQADTIMMMTAIRFIVIGVFFYLIVSFSF